MNKSTVLLIIAMFIISGFVSAGVSKQQDDIRLEIEQVNFSKNLSIKEENGFLLIDLIDTSMFIDEPGSPRLPMYQTVFEFSKNAKIYDVSLDFGSITTSSISEKITPTSQSLPVNYPDIPDNDPTKNQNKQIYESNDMYPENWFDYSIKCGLNDFGEETTFVIVDIYPLRYQPLTDKIHTISNAEIQISYNDVQTEIYTQNTDTFDLLIIAPEVFVDSLQPLISHKESIDITTTVKTVEDILAEYTGRDQPEQIKYFIKDAKENWDTQFVLLMGGLKSYIYAKDKDDRNHGSTNGWHVPVRYTNIRNSNEVGVISDLYYSDLYRYNEEMSEWEFEDWDSSGDGIFANSEMGNKRDILDLIPDLYVGRLACRTNFEVKTVVDKIINYESSSKEDKPWYTRMIGIGGRTFDLFDGGDQLQQTESDCKNISTSEWQEFIPRKEILSRIELKVQSLDPSASDLVVALEKPLGSSIATSGKAVSEIPSDDADWISFDFNNVLLTPGEDYYIVVSSQAAGEYSWCYGEPILPGISRYQPGNSSAGSDLDWCFKTYDLPEGVEKPDGEYSVDTAFRFMEPVIDEEIRVYWSNEGTDDPVPETQDIIDAFNLGAGYINMEGHGNPLSWATHPVPPDAPFTGGLSITDFPQIKNGDKLPIVVVGGCHNALFNVSLIRTIIGRPHDNWYWTSGYVTPICFCWAMCASPIGGAIASTGCTGLGLGGTPPDLEKSGGLDCNFFYKVGAGATTLGEAHSGAIQKYILENNVVVDEEFCIVEFHLFGDPSLQLGGAS